MYIRTKELIVKKNCFITIPISKTSLFFICLLSVICLLNIIALIQGHSLSDKKINTKNQIYHIKYISQSDTEK